METASEVDLQQRHSTQGDASAWGEIQAAVALQRAKVEGLVEGAAPAQTFESTPKRGNADFSCESPSHEQTTDTLKEDVFESSPRLASADTASDNATASVKDEEEDEEEEDEEDEEDDYEEEDEDDEEDDEEAEGEEVYEEEHAEQATVHQVSPTKGRSFPDNASESTTASPVFKRMHDLHALHQKRQEDLARKREQKEQAEQQQLDEALRSSRRRGFEPPSRLSGAEASRRLYEDGQENARRRQTRQSQQEAEARVLTMASSRTGAECANRLYQQASSRQEDRLQRLRGTRVDEIPTAPKSTLSARGSSFSQASRSGNWTPRGTWTRADAGPASLSSPRPITTPRGPRLSTASRPTAVVQATTPRQPPPAERGGGGAQRGLAAQLSEARAQLRERDEEVARLRAELQAERAHSARLMRRAADAEARLARASALGMTGCEEDTSLASGLAEVGAGCRLSELPEAGAEVVDEEALEPVDMGIEDSW